MKCPKCPKIPAKPKKHPREIAVKTSLIPPPPALAIPVVVVPIAATHSRIVFPVWFDANVKKSA
jgi:hypothetical protein